MSSSKIGRISSVGRAAYGMMSGRKWRPRTGYQSNGIVGYSIRINGMKKTCAMTISALLGGTLMGAMWATVASACALLVSLAICASIETSFLAQQILMTIFYADI